MIKIYLFLWAIIIGLFLTGVAFADHNSHLNGYSDKRGYNKRNCENLYSNTTGKQAEWLGHLVGCLIDDGSSYVLVMEYRVETLSREQGDYLREATKEYETRIEL